MTNNELAHQNALLEDKKLLLQEIVKLEGQLCDPADLARLGEAIFDLKYFIDCLPDLSDKLPDPGKIEALQEALAALS